MAVTLREVAEAAGVSTAAVSKVLHGRGDSVRVSEARADHIRRIAQQMAYQPNALARSLRNRRTHTVGLVFENFGPMHDGPLYYAQLLGGVGSVLFNRHYRLTILPELDSDDALASFADGLLEGVIWCKLTHDPAVLEQIRRSPIPIVALNAGAPEPSGQTIFISCDNEGGIRQAVEHLVSLGHRHIAFLSESQEADTPDCLARRAGYQQAMTDRGLESDALQWEWNLGEFAAWWATSPRTTAVICWTESLAGRFMARAATYGIDVPHRLSVVGFDSTQYCETLSPSLTAVRQPIFEMARAGAESLLARIAGDPAPLASLIFPCSLDARGSTGTVFSSSHPSLNEEK
jgi:DNA-binding LacI/PurR family transcriptional regulator